MIFRKSPPTVFLAVLVALLAVASAAPAAPPPSLQLLTDGPFAADPDLHMAFGAASEDGSRIVIATTETMTGTDTDATWDLYALSAGAAPIHLTDNRVGPDAALDVSFLGMSADGGYVYFNTREALAATDTDALFDIYAYTPTGALVHVSDNPTGPDADHIAKFDDISRDGTRAYFETAERLAATDTDDVDDAYELGPGGLRHLSDNPIGPDAQLPVHLLESSDDGSRLYFRTDESLAATDTDASRDVYMRGAAGALVHVSDNPTGPDANLPAFFAGQTQDGSRLWFETAESMAPGDTDNSLDIYERRGALLTQVSKDPIGVESAFDASLAGWSDDGSHVFFQTAETLALTDLDTAQDIYERTPTGALVHVSDNPTGPDANAPVFVEGSSSDARHVLMATQESLAPTDTDLAYDLYMRSEGVGLVHVSDTPGGGPDADYEAWLEEVSSDGSRVYLGTVERMAAADTDAAADTYLATFAADPPQGGGQGGGAPGGGGEGGVDATPPRLSHLRVQPRIGAVARFRLSEDARVRFVARRGGRALGSFAINARRGANRTPLEGRLGARRLRQGPYRLIATPTDGAGNRGVPRSVLITVNAKTRSRSR